MTKHNLRASVTGMDLYVTSEDKAEATVVSNLFIDKYLKDANDAQIKVYLYLLRMMSAGLSTDISKMADLFNYTERDIVRSLEYWKKCGLLELDYDSFGLISGVKFLEMGKTKKAAKSEPVNDAFIGEPASNVTLKVVPDDEPVVKIRENVTYTLEQLKAFKESGETAQIVFVAEQYLKRTLSSADIQALYFIYDELKFTCEMTDYLLQYCLDKGKDSFSYIKKVDINWAQAGITTPKQAKALSTTKYEKYVYTILKALGKSNIPQAPEVDMVNKWYKEYGFDIEVILEACNRTVMATDSHRLEYCDKILSSWKKENVHHMSDIAKADEKFKQNRTKTSNNEKSNGTFGQFAKTDYDFDSLEKILSGQ